MQSYTEITDSTTLQASLSKILENDKTAMSMSAGTAFPTTNLQQGMPCYRTDLKKLYVLTAITFSGGVAVGSTWEMLADLSAPALPQLNPNVLGTMKLGEGGRTTIGEYGDGGLLVQSDYSIFAARNSVHLASNARHNGTAWVRIDPTKAATMVELHPAGMRYYIAQLTANPIIWTGGHEYLHAGNFSAASFLAKSGGAMTGPITLAGNAAGPLQPVTLQQLQAATSGAAGAGVAKTGDTMSGPLTVPTIYAHNWLRSLGSTGWYSETYGGGWHMTDTIYLRSFNDKMVYGGNGFKTGGSSSTTGYRISTHQDLGELFWHFLGQTFPQRTRTFSTFQPGSQINGLWEIQPIQDGTNRAYATRPYYTNCACAACNCDCGA
jgi:hypothetical protein